MKVHAVAPYADDEHERAAQNEEAKEEEEKVDEEEELAPRRPRHAKAPKQMGRKRMGVLSRKLAELGCVAVPMAIVLCEFTYFTGTPAAAAYTAR